MLDDVAGVGVDGLLCLGDLVGYGADPGPVVDALAGRGAVVVAGNHDHAAAGLLDLAWFNPYARAAAEWTAGVLAPDQTRYLATLPLTTAAAGATLVHASPRNPADWPYLLSPADGLGAFAAFTTPLCFVGHSHVPTVWTIRGDGGLAWRRGPARLPLVPGERHLINVGSVGQPRDGDPDAAYALWDQDAAVVVIRRVRYDVGEARRRIHAAGLPAILGDRLVRGR